MRPVGRHPAASEAPVKGCKLVATANGVVYDTFAATHAGLLSAQRSAERRAQSLNHQTTTVVRSCDGARDEVLVRCTPRGCTSGARLGAPNARDEGRKRALLAKSVKFHGQVMTKAQMMEALARQGGVLKRDRFSKYVFSRRAYNRMDAAEQRAYDLKMQTKMPFAVELPDGTYFEVTQTEAEYFTSVGGTLGRGRRRVRRRRR